MPLVQNPYLVHSHPQFVVSGHHSSAVHPTIRFPPLQLLKRCQTFVLLNMLNIIANTSSSTLSINKYMSSLIRFQQTLRYICHISHEAFRLTGKNITKRWEIYWLCQKKWYSYSCCITISSVRSLHILYHIYGHMQTGKPLCECECVKVYFNIIYHLKTLF